MAVLKILKGIVRKWRRKSDEMSQLKWWYDRHGAEINQTQWWNELNKGMKWTRYVAIKWTRQSDKISQTKWLN